ncbi:MAG: phytanoyl-CoA dioxygenase family protein [Boseongicola sp.]
MDVIAENPNLRADFERDGFVAIRPLYDKPSIAEIKENVERLVRDVVPNMPAAQVYYEDKADKSSLKQLQKIFEYDAYFNDLMLNGAPRRIAEEVLQNQVVPVNMQYFNKPPKVGQPTPAHQDGYYFHLSPCEAVTGWLALEDVDEETGCVRYVRGSHNEAQFRPHGQTGVLGFSQGITDYGTPEDVAGEVAFPGVAGTFLMHHAKTIHLAGGNQSSNRTRRALGFIYYSKAAKLDVAAKEAYQAALDEHLKDNEKI